MIKSDAQPNMNMRSELVVIALAAPLVLLAASLIVLNGAPTANPAEKLPILLTGWLMIVPVAALVALLFLFSMFHRWARSRTAKVAVFVGFGAVYLTYSSLILGYFRFYADSVQHFGGTAANPWANKLTISLETYPAVGIVFFSITLVVAVGITSLFFAPPRKAYGSRSDYGAMTLTPGSRWSRLWKRSRPWFPAVSQTSFALASTLGVAAIIIFIFGLLRLAISYPGSSETTLSIHPPQFTGAILSAVVVGGYFLTIPLVIIGTLAAIFAPKAAVRVA